MRKGQRRRRRKKRRKKKNWRNDENGLGMIIRVEKIRETWEKVFLARILLTFIVLFVVRRVRSTKRVFLIDFYPVERVNETNCDSSLCIKNRVSERKKSWKTFRCCVTRKNRPIRHIDFLRLRWLNVIRCGSIKLFREITGKRFSNR